MTLQEILSEHTSAYVDANFNSNAGGNDTFILDFGIIDAGVNASSHHIYRQGGNDVFNLTNIYNVSGFLSGRIDDFDPTRDTIQIEGVALDFDNLPDNVKIVNFLSRWREPELNVDLKWSWKFGPVVQVSRTYSDAQITRKGSAPERVSAADVDKLHSPA